MLRLPSNIGDVQRWEANAPRYRGNGRGHYESYFLRANHPERAIGFWLRYTIFVPARGRARAARAEVWAAVFRPGSSVAVRAETPLTPASFVGNVEALDVRVGHAVLHDDPLVGRGSLRGAVTNEGHEIRWDLAYDGGTDPVLLLPESFYDGLFPKAKALVPVPMARFDGQIAVDGDAFDITGWVGSANHNWGTKHTDAYAWGQVAGFDNAADSFLECSSAHLKLAGPVWAPWLSPLVLHHDGVEYTLNSLSAARRAQAAYDVTGPTYTWSLRASTVADETPVDITVNFQAPASDFVIFEYANPPGGVKCCRNSKIAQCRVQIAKVGSPPIILTAANRAAFEVVT